MIEKILEKTRRKGESKKWKTYIFAFIGILLIIAGFFGGMWIIGVFDYIHDTKEITNLYEFYESNVGQDGLDTVYFIGSSIVGCAIYPPEINRQLKDRGTNINVYNLCLNGDIPIERTLEIQKIIDTRPSLVIFGITYRSIVDGISEARFIERIKLVSNYLSIREDSLYLFNDDEKNLLNSYFDYTYLKSFIDSASAYKHTVKNPEKEKTLEYVVDPYGDKFRKYISTLKNPTEIYRQSEDPTDNWRPVVTSEKTRYKEALIYNVKTLQDESIPVIIINMPLHPLFSDKITDESRQNFYTLLNETGAKWYDMERDYDDDFFYDSHHAMFEEGALVFAPRMADLILRELS